MNDDLLVKYLAGEADEQERIRVAQWLRDERNAKEYSRMERIWLESQQLASTSSPDEHAAWDRFNKRIQRQEQEGQMPREAQFPPLKTLHGSSEVPLRSSAQSSSGPLRNNQNQQWLRAAAALALLVAVGWLGWYFVQQYNRAVVELASGEEVKEATLSDGTEITLNKNSQLSYSRRFYGPDRAVSLAGEAFFHVAPNENKPFIIYVNELKVVVTGTSFNIKSRDGITEVIVETGSVNVSKGSREVALQPGEKTISISGSQNLVKQSTRNALYKYYRTNQFVCSATPLQELVDALNDAYHAKITVPDPALQQLAITTVFENESLDRILEVISDTFDITIQYEEKQIILKR